MNQLLNKFVKEAIDAAPVGTSGLATAPWAIDEVYGVAANWSEESDTIWTFGDGEWMPTGKQVADYRHDPRAALESELFEALVASGDDGEEAPRLADTAIEF